MRKTSLIQELNAKVGLDNGGNKIIPKFMENYRSVRNHDENGFF